MDRFVEDALKEFSEWYVNDPEWLGKERDCVNKFVTQFLNKNIVPGTAIGAHGQIRIECAVMQPSLTDSSGQRKYPKPSATKDIVIWRNPEDTTWDADWQAKNEPRAIIEWKTSRSGNVSETFDEHDRNWLIDFTTEHPKTMGFLVATHSAKGERHCKWAAVRRGIVRTIHRSA
jgi:hypothetical protein